MYIFAIALEDGFWHHVKSYAPERAQRSSTVDLWRKISTIEDPRWEAMYHDPDPNKKGFGGHVVITMKDGRVIEDELAVANAHSNGAHPFERKDYIKKFDTLTEGIIETAERNRFIQATESLNNLDGQSVKSLNVQVEISKVISNQANHKGIF